MRKKINMRRLSSATGLNVTGRKEINRNKFLKNNFFFKQKFQYLAKSLVLKDYPTDKVEKLYFDLFSNKVPNELTKIIIKLS